MGLLDGQVAIVTGAGQGLGRAISLEFAREGAAVALLERNADSAAETAQLIADVGGEARDYPLDITDYDAYGRVVNDVIVWKGQIDTLVNNAAIAIYGTILNDTLDGWRKQIEEVAAGEPGRPGHERCLVRHRDSSSASSVVHAADG